MLKLSQALGITTPAGGGGPAGVVLMIDDWEEVVADLA